MLWRNEKLIKQILREKMAASSCLVYHSRSASWDAVQINIDESHNVHLSAALSEDNVGTNTHCMYDSVRGINKWAEMN